VDEIIEQVDGIISKNHSNKDSRLFFVSPDHKSRQVAFRFDNIDVPQDAQIQSASLILTASAEDTEESELEEWQVVDSRVAETTPATGDFSGLDIKAPGINLEAASPSVTADTLAEREVASNSISMNVKAEVTGTPLPYEAAPLSGRAFTPKFTPWDDIRFNPEESMTSPNLAAVVERVINNSTWNNGQSLSIMLSAPTTYNNILENSGLINTTLGAAAPQLQIVWKPNTVAETTAKDSQTTAIRFTNVHVPPRAKIKSARLVFNSSKASLGPVSLEISAEKNSASSAFVAVNNNINGRDRPRTGEKVSWDVEPWELPNTKYYSDNINEVVQEVINLPEWCGGNPLSIFLSKLAGSDSRFAVSADTNEVAAPSLEITYEPGSVEPGAYCSNATVLSSISNDNADGVEDMVSNTVDLTGVSLDTINPANNNPQLIGLRFPSLSVPKNAVVVSATLELTHAQDITVPQDYKFRAIKTVTTPEFGPGANSISSTSRVPYLTTVTATVQPGIAVESKFSVDVQPLVSAKVMDAEWEPGKPFVITAEALGGIAQSFSIISPSGTSLARFIEII